MAACIRTTADDTDMYRLGGLLLVKFMLLCYDSARFMEET